MPIMASRGENINHFNAVRIRVVGEGNLQLKFQSLDDVQDQDLVELAMSVATNIQPTRLSNFKQQRARLELRTLEIDEWFKINRIIIFMRPIATSYPG